MADLGDVKAKITLQVTTLTGLASKLVRWVDEPSGDLTGALPVVWLRLSSIVCLGIDYETRTDNGADEQTVTVDGQTQFTLSVRIESFTPDFADARSAVRIGESLRTRLFRTSAIIDRTGIFSVSRVLMTKWFSYVEAGRPISTYLLDVLCMTAGRDVDTTTGAGDWIGEAEITGTIKDGPPDSTIATVDIDVVAD